MQPSFRAFMSGVIDYAGLFPPAELPLDQAAADFALHRDGPERWMLGRFVVPGSRLPELGAHLPALTARAAEVAEAAAVAHAADAADAEHPDHATAHAAHDASLRLSVIAGGGGDAAGFLEGLARSLDATESFLGAGANRELARVEALEMKLPAGELADTDGAAELIRHAHHLISNRLLGTPACFFEAAIERDWAGPVEQLTVALARAAERGPGTPGLKLRCGGASATAFPTAGALAHALVRSRREAHLPLKFTAGLHHPLPRPEAVLGVRMHGFLNVLGAALLAAADPRFGDAEARAMLEDAEPSHFAFLPRRFTWRVEDPSGEARGEFSVENEAIETLRGVRVTSFGSCSFREPSDDLRGLGLLAGASGARP